MNEAKDKTLKLRPIVQVPRRARPGGAYLMTVDLEPVDPEDWPYEQEECVLTLILDTMPLFEHQAIGEPTIVLHRFGGTYGETRHLLRANESELEGEIRITLVSENGLPIETICLADIRVSEEIERPEHIEKKKQIFIKSGRNGANVPHTQPSSAATDDEVVRKEVSDSDGYFTPGYIENDIADRDIAEDILSAPRDLKTERELRWHHERTYKNMPPDGRPAPDVDPLSLASSGWGIIIPEGTPRAVLDALRPLLDLRREQASGRREHYYRELDYIHGEAKDSFFRRHSVEAGPPHPSQLPYYLLIIGGPEIVPFRFQYLLDLQYAVGRLAFDEPDDYRSYAESVVAAEHGKYDVRPETCIFSTRHPRDKASSILSERLIRPLVETLERENSETRLRLLEGEQASKDALRRLLGYGETPALLLTASHGLQYRSDHPLQREQQGAIICQDWPGRKGPVLKEHYLAAHDIGDDARLHGLIAFFLSSSSAGTPETDDFPPEGWGQPTKPPSRPFISGLARRLLSHRNGSALAIIGHVDRNWISSFGTGRGKGIIHFERLFKDLLTGLPVGSAMRWMSQRYAELSTELSDYLSPYTNTPKAQNLKASQREDLAHLWRAVTDARNYIVLGDPAARLATGPQIGQYTDPSVPIAPLISSKAENPPLIITVNRWRLDRSPPGALLRADYGVVPFHLRHNEINNLEAWCRSGDNLGIRLYTGAGGMGKTRLALEICRRLRVDGWQAGLVDPERPLEETWHDLTEIGGPRLLVVDYAETQRPLLVPLLHELYKTEDEAPIRLLLLARAALDWWEQLKAEGDGVGELLSGPATQWHTLQPLASSVEERAESYRIAAMAFADRLDKKVPEQLPDDLYADHYKYAYVLHMRAFAEIDDVEVDGEEGILDYVLARERRWWRKLAVERSLPETVVPGIGKAMAAITLSGGIDSEDNAVASIAALKFFTGQSRDVLVGVARLLRDIYPGEEQWIEPLTPDVLGEHLVMREMETTPADLLDSMPKPTEPIDLVLQFSTTLVGGDTVTKTKILFLGSNPLDSRSRLELDEEVDRIQTDLEHSKELHMIDLRKIWAVTVDTLMQAILDETPRIVHFSGHGCRGRIVLQDETGKPKFVTTESLSSLFELFKDCVECVVLNPCYSEAQARAIKLHIPHVVGMKHEIPDKAAISFLSGFYKAIGAGRDISFAFDLGVVAIKLEGVSGDHIPVMF